MKNYTRNVTRNPFSFVSFFVTPTQTENATTAVTLQPTAFSLPVLVKYISSVQTKEKVSLSRLVSVFSVIDTMKVKKYERVVRKLVVLLRMSAFTPNRLLCWFTCVICKCSRKARTEWNNTDRFIYMPIFIIHKFSACLARYFCADRIMQSITLGMLLLKLLQKIQLIYLTTVA